MLPTSLALFAIAAFGAFAPCCSTAAAQQQQGTNKSWTGSITSGFKDGVDKISRIGKPDEKSKGNTSKDDPVSLSSEAKPSPKVHVAVAQLYEQSGKVEDAAQQYLSALKLQPDYLPALLGYARLLEQQGRSEDAIRLYRRAVETNPKEAGPAFNNMGLCLARAGRNDEAIAALSESVRLDPKNPLYRNNIAVLLVERERYRDAYAHLRAVHQQAAAYYNMGYLLAKHGRNQESIQHFSWALRADPEMIQAKQWLDYLRKEPALARRPEQPPPALNEFSRPREFASPEPQREIRGEPQGEPAPLPPERPRTRRLPPPDNRGPARPSSGSDRAIPYAPLPPSSNAPSVRPLPRVVY